MSEIKSYKLADDGNMVTIMMKDGTVHNSLIFLDDGELYTMHCAIKLKEDAYLSSPRKFSSITFLLCYTAFPFENAITLTEQEYTCIKLRPQASITSPGPS